jgi:hypothetical protein
MSELTLVERGLERRVHELNRILQRDNMNGLVGVDFVEQRGQRDEPFAGQRRAADELRGY